MHETCVYVNSTRKYNPQNEMYKQALFSILKSATLKRLTNNPLDVFFFISNGLFDFETQKHVSI